ncbi:hypothetical protein EVAR_51228_1 [Eumeta japonica]|uniref:ATP-dependent helicase C-terminal domain-containing protein n=1 Tax=Eumeta variegata TaxID=151549 RepID=A0A4C1ZDS8_EUMVA|nr:hypothetical protein EVAR_51228_1 [Eumeta japonica]
MAGNIHYIKSMDSNVGGVVNQVVLMSHAGLVGGAARAGRGVRLRGHVLVVDEAHALVPALQRAHAAPLPRTHLHILLIALRRYTRHYATRLASRHLLCLNQIIFIVGRLLGLFEQTPMASKKHEETEIYILEDFVIKAEIDHLNLRQLVEFCKKRKLAPILHGFSLRYNISESAEQTKANTEINRNPLQTFLSSISMENPKESITENIGKVPASDECSRKEGFDCVDISAGGALYALLEFLERLCERSAMGRVLVACGPPQGAHLKYLLLDPTRPFLDLVHQCRSVIVAGGTMEPMSEFEGLLGARDLTLLRCDHVVPDDHVLGICLSEGPSGMPLCFSYENRNSKRSLDEISCILKNLSSVVPEGIVCFLPSYVYEQTLYTHMENNKIIHSIAKKKKIFREPKLATGVDKILVEYSAAAAHGALLLSVVGGKLSEGLNFSDELGRCVLVVGMPYPNIKSVELQEKMNYLNRTCGGNAGNVYYENLCMKAVNQCIGRAVRHARDYACVVLADGRYSRGGTRAALPAYIQKRSDIRRPHATPRLRHELEF